MESVKIPKGSGFVPCWCQAINSTMDEFFLLFASLGHIKTFNFSFGKYFWKCLQNFGQFVQDSMCKSKTKYDIVVILSPLCESPS